LWNLGGVVGLTVQGAPFFLGEPENNGWDTPTAVGTRTVRVEVFVDDPDSFIERAVAAGADGSVDEVRDHEAPWGIHRQGGFLDPFGHLWLVGDRSPLRAHDSSGTTCARPSGRLVAIQYCVARSSSARTVAHASFLVARPYSFGRSSSSAVGVIRLLSVPLRWLPRT
jgi:PhnB protein